MDSASSYDTVIVGGGLAGTTVAAELALVAPSGFHALLIDAGSPGPGSAYAPQSERLYMNGPAVAMSAVPGDKRHLVRWLRSHGEYALIPRSLFGRYLADRFHRAVARRPEFAIARAEVVDVVPQDAGFIVIDADGLERVARNVVLALGNFPPDDSFLPAAMRTYCGFVADPWRGSGSSFGSARGDTLVIGSGLTAMDAIALLEERGFEGRVHIVSRHGLLPSVENPLAGALDPKTLTLHTESPYALLRSLRAAARLHMHGGGDWRDVAESIRAHSPAIWMSWSLRDRKRFLRHLQAFWAVHRYRVPPVTAQAYARLERENRIVRHRGAVATAAVTTDGRLAVTIDGANATTVTVSSAINCTGPMGDYERLRHPLVRNLLRRGVLRPDPLRLGLDATPDLRVIDRCGYPNPHLFALGPPLRGILYETTAVPETREQAAQIARALVRSVDVAGLEVAS